MTSDVDLEKLYERLKRLHEPKGYHFNKDKTRTFELLRGLIKNKERYGYMCCPCRLANNDRVKDKDIICPCVYRAPDVEEYGSCYCNLYVSKEWNDDKIAHVYVPERRPPENFSGFETEDEDLPFCTTAASAEHYRAENEDEPCDDGRAGRVRR